MHQESDNMWCMENKIKCRRGSEGPTAAVSWCKGNTVRLRRVRSVDLGVFSKKVVCAHVGV